MKRILIIMFIALFVLAVTLSWAEETPTKAKKDCAAACAARKAEGSKDANDPHAGCLMKGEAQATTASAPAADKAAGAEETTAKDAHCPDVAGKDKLVNFHEPMHVMHTALNDGKYDTLRFEMANLDKAAAALADYKCPMDDKCSAECKKGFEAKKANLMNTVGELKTACAGTDNEVVKTAFMNLHTAYIEFASVCKMGKTEESKSATEEKK